MTPTPFHLDRRLAGTLWRRTRAVLALSPVLLPAGGRPPAAEPPILVVLGIAQDGGVPQAGTPPGRGDTLTRLVASLAVVEPDGGRRWLFEATPDLRPQLRLLDSLFPVSARPGLDGIFGEPVRLTAALTVTPLAVPHRGEYSEVVGYRIEGQRRRVLFVPDIDSWDAWDRAGVRLEQVLAGVDVAYLDGTFFRDGEIPGRDMSGFPHPRIADTMARLGTLPASERAKVRFIHLNHTNPALDPDGPEARLIRQNGFGLAVEGERLAL